MLKAGILSCIHKTAASLVIYNRDAIFPPQRYQFGKFNPVRKPFNAKIAGVYSQQYGRPGINDLFIILNICTVCSSYFNEPGSALFHYIWDPEPPSYLNSLA